MNDDWRVEVTCPTTATSANLGEVLREGDFQHELQSAAGERVIVSVDGPTLFLYAGSREQADRAAEVARSLVAKSGVSVTTKLTRWHPVAEEWLDPDQPEPEGGQALSAEHAELIAQERAESAELKRAEWEVRVSTRSHRETLELAARLRDEGIPYMRRWRYLVVGAADEDAAGSLATRIRAIAPADSEIEVEATPAVVEAEVYRSNPFVVFGGLGV